MYVIPNVIASPLQAARSWCFTRCLQAFVEAGQFTDWSRSEKAADGVSSLRLKLRFSKSILAFRCDQAIEGTLPTLFYGQVRIQRGRADCPIVSIVASADETKMFRLSPSASSADAYTRGDRGEFQSISVDQLKALSAAAKRGDAQC